MTTIQIHGVTLSAHAGMNMREAFPDLFPAPDSPVSGSRKWRDHAETEARKARDRARADKLARRVFWLNS